MEGIPLSVLEAMSARLPVIATRVGGVPEVIEDGVSGILVPEGSPERLREAIGRIQRDRGLSREIAGGGRLRVERDYDAKKTSREVADLYHELLQGTAAGRPVDRAE
jgi:glycosyltransferase involved in cell wall biosynthesis